MLCLNLHHRGDLRLYPEAPRLRHAVADLAAGWSFDKRRFMQVGEGRQVKADLIRKISKD